jgi:gamma-glutamyltranspeptidase/glutathione hydrolase
MRTFAPSLYACAFAWSLVTLSDVSFAASREPVRAKHAMVSTSSELASKVGVEILQKGGNAVDAAVAVSLALAVTLPNAGNLGGGGFLLVRKADGKAEVIDYRETAPLAATRDMYLDSKGEVIPNASTLGHKAVGVPGTVAGLALALDRHGKMKWADLVAPAQKLAHNGYALTSSNARAWKKQKDVLEASAETKRIFLPSGSPLEEGATFKQPDLARTFQRLAKNGPREFYEGETARLIAEDMKAHGGLVTAQDLKEYKPVIRKPLIGQYRGYEIITMPPPSSGGAILLEMLNVLENIKLKEQGRHSSAALHSIVETMKRAYADRAELMADADFVKVPVTGMISKKYAQEMFKGLNLTKAIPSTEVRFGEPGKYESPETTHFTIVDKEGNVVSNTYTLNGNFGSGIVAKGTGVLLNNEMDDFTAKPGVPNLYKLIQNERNAIVPKKRPLSSMSPTILTKDGKAFLALGSPGGSTIPNSVLQVVLNMVDFGLNVQEAVDSPRFHHQWMPDLIRWEPHGINADTRDILEKKGHKFNENPSSMGDVQAIYVDPVNGDRFGASDPRETGVSVGY